MKAQEILDQFLTPQEVAKEYGIDESVVRRACIDGTLPCGKKGSTWLILKEDAAVKWKDITTPRPGRPKGSRNRNVQTSEQ
jgi:hypothetical protein